MLFTPAGKPPRQDEDEALAEIEDEEAVNPSSDLVSQCVCIRICHPGY